MNSGSIYSPFETRSPRTKLVCPRPPRPLHGSVPVGSVRSAVLRQRGHTTSHRRQKCVPFPFKECLRATLVFYPKHGRQSAARSPNRCVPATAPLPPRGHTTSTWRDPIGCVPAGTVRSPNKLVSATDLVLRPRGHTISELRSVPLREDRIRATFELHSKHVATLRIADASVSPPILSGVSPSSLPCPRPRFPPASLVCPRRRWCVPLGSASPSARQSCGCGDTPSQNCDPSHSVKIAFVQHLHPIQNMSLHFDSRTPVCPRRFCRVCPRPRFPPASLVCPRH